MCSYNITLDDALVKQAKPSFANDKALKLWLQQQMEELLRNHVRQESLIGTIQDKQAVPDVVLSLLGACAPLADNDLNERNSHYQYLEEKHQ